MSTTASTPASRTILRRRETSPTANVWRGPGPASAFPHAPRDDIDALTFIPLGTGGPMRWDASLVAAQLPGMPAPAGSPASANTDPTTLPAYHALAQHFLASS